MQCKAKDLWRFKSRTINPSYDAGLRLLQVASNTPLFDSCLIHDNSDKLVRVKTAPKWVTKLAYDEVDQETGEILAPGEYETNEIKQSNGRKIAALDAFCGFYQPLYSRRQVSLMFHTFTRANQSNQKISTMIDNVKLHYKRNMGRPVRGLIWVSEISERLHWHYHLCLAVDRLELKRIPQELRFEGLWGQRTEVEFVKKNVRHYMAKYFAKHQSRVIGVRAFGRSRQFY